MVVDWFTVVIIRLVDWFTVVIIRLLSPQNFCEKCYISIITSHEINIFIHLLIIDQYWSKTYFSEMSLKSCFTGAGTHMQTNMITDVVDKSVWACTNRILILLKMHTADVKKYAKK